MEGPDFPLIASLPMPSHLLTLKSTTFPFASFLAIYRACMEGPDFPLIASLPITFSHAHPEIH